MVVHLNLGYWKPALAPVWWAWPAGTKLPRNAAGRCWLSEDDLGSRCYFFTSLILLPGQSMQPSPCPWSLLPWHLPSSSGAGSIGPWGDGG